MHRGRMRGTWCPMATARVVLPQAGPSLQMNWYNVNAGGSTTPAGTRGDDADAMNGNAVMYDAVAGKIFTCGGAPSYQVRSS